MSKQERSSEWDEGDLELSRRAFLRMAGFAFMGAMTGCQRAPTQSALSPAAQAEHLVPGRSLPYASTCGACPAACGILAKNRDGRPIKLEGDPNHPISLGGLCAAGQASILGLYDSERLRRPLENGQETTWVRVDAEVRTLLNGIRRDGRKVVRFLTGTIASPTTQQAIANFLASFPNNRPKHVVADPISSSAILDAHQRTHGVRVLPTYRLERANAIVSFDADFLGTWIAPVAFAAAYQAGRVLQGPAANVSHHTHFESRLSLTGSKADARVCVAPGESGLVLTQLAARVAQRAGRAWGGDLPPSSVPPRFLDELADRLWAARGKSLVLSGANDLAEQSICNFLNHLLQNYDATIDVAHPSYQSQANDRDLRELIGELERGEVGALFVSRSNPIFDLPEGPTLLEKLRDVALTVDFSPRRDETAAASRFVCPEPHYLESWSDAEIADGVVSLHQPVLEPLGETRPIVESLAAWTDRPRSAYDQVRDHWQARVFPRKLISSDFREFWDQAVHDGSVRVKTQATPRPYDATTVIEPIRQAIPAAADSFSVVLYAKVGMPDGSHAYNPWLQELPDPLTKATWDNYACLSPETAGRLNLRQGDTIRFEGVAGLELPVLVQPGQHDQAIAVALGYGSTLSERFASIGPPWLEARTTVGPDGKVGVNAARLLTWHDGNLRCRRDGVRIVKGNEHRPIACTQELAPIVAAAAPAPPAARGRQPLPVVRETTLPAIRRPAAEMAEAPKQDLWPDDHPIVGPRWGMAIDLSACTGCSACVIACQAENNIPVVGKDEVRRHREMHWLRIDRYYARPARSPVDAGPTRSTEIDVAHQPMLCQQCGNAPCETVCPVLATVHSDDGLNQQVYNRCVGTRYCANNCPYKVRRFNWFDYAHDDQLQNLVLNPDVTVRSRGVMEKCTFCVQRIQEAKIEARRLGSPLADGDIQTACQQSCPSKVIVFGDLNDPRSKAAQLAKSARAYKTLDELDVQPAVSYLAVVRNRQEGAAS